MSGIIFISLRFLLVLALYAFLGWSIYTLWNDLRLKSTTAMAHTIPEITLSAPELDNLIKSFVAPEITLGRDSICNLMVPDETISSQHARLSYHHSQWWVEDMQSTNGTYLNEERLTTPTVVMDGDEIKLGKINLQISIKKKK
jgi:pSer/pThr/pTyr-binding forkhead associated (FHA) protein